MSISIAYMDTHREACHFRRCSRCRKIADTGCWYVIRIGALASSSVVMLATKVILPKANFCADPKDLRLLLMWTLLEIEDIPKQYVHTHFSHLGRIQTFQWVQ
jgi:hypothetical protein